MESVLPPMQLMMEPFVYLKVTAKIRSLYDYQLRLMQNMQPVPSGVDIGNTVKYFSQTLLSVLKDVISSPLELIRDPSNDHIRMALYPNLDYKGLYYALSQLVDSAPQIQYGAQAFGQAVLQCLGCLLPFLEYDQIDNLPYLVAYCVAVFPVTLHQDILNLLCYYILPFTITRRYEPDEESEASQSVAAIIMMVFQHSSNPAHHCQLLECLMTMKPTVVKDILCVIAYGTSGARLSAAKLLFYYWPPFDAKLFDRKGLICKFSNDINPLPCQRDSCPNAGVSEASKVCFDHCISVTFACDTPPPLYLCIECANEIHREHPNQRFYDMLHPMQQVSMVCENKNCRSSDKLAYSICFSSECASFNGNHPIRYCLLCHNNRHNRERGSEHVVHTRLSADWDHLHKDRVEAVLSLLNESKPLDIEDPDMLCDLIRPSVNKTIDPICVEDRELLGRYGVWLLVGLCSPDGESRDEVMIRLLSMLFHWFHVTSYAYTGESSSRAEKLKWEHVVEWVVACPRHLVETTLGVLNKTTKTLRSYRPALHRLYSLMPYGIISQDIWETIMPQWMEAICTYVTQQEVQELKLVLCKIFEPDCPLVGIDEKKMYNFARKRLAEDPVPETVMPALNWLQTLSFVDVRIPLDQLLEMFTTAVVNMPEVLIPKPTEKQSNGFQVMERFKKDKQDSEDPHAHITCCIVMLDILLKQMELQKRRFIINNISVDVINLLRLMLKANHLNTVEHAKCLSEGSCSYCEGAGLFQQLSVALIKKIYPEKIRPPMDCADESWSEARSKCDDDSMLGLNPSVMGLNPSALGLEGIIPHSDKASLGGVLIHVPHFVHFMQLSVLSAASGEEFRQSQDENIMTATVESIKGQHDIGVFLPSMDAKSKTGSDLATSTTVSANAVESKDEKDDNGSINKSAKSQSTTDELPQHLKYVDQLILELKSTSRPDVVYHLLESLLVLVQNADAISDQVFFNWCHDNDVIDSAWCVWGVRGASAWARVASLVAARGGRLAPEQSQPLALTLLFRFMDPSLVKSSVHLQSSLATAFCYLIDCMDDTDVNIAQEATLYIGTLHDEAVDLLLFCLESQFDLVMLDRPMILQAIYQLHNTLGDRKILTWQFFLNRFESLMTDAQSTKNHDTIHGKGNSCACRGVCVRAASAPIPTLHKTVQDREKIYSRQYSAPILKRKTSRFGIGQLLTAPGGPKSHIFDASSIIGEEPHKQVDLEEIDRETANLLVFLLMQFLSRQDQAQPIEDKEEGKIQDAVLKHLFTLIGYNMIERHFHTSPGSMRQSSVFNAFMASLPQMLDQNPSMGASILESVLLVLQYCIGPPSGASSSSLLVLQSHVRRHWLFALLVILYKYQYNVPPCGAIIQSLIRVVLNTIDALQHKCKRIPALVVMREHSQPSLKTEQNAMTMVKNANARQPWNEHESYRFQHWNAEQESSESDLIAIPETSDKSDTTMHGSTAPGSFDEPSHFDEHHVKVELAHMHIKQVIASKSALQLSTSSSASVGSDSSHVKSTPQSGHSGEICDVTFKATSLKPTGYTSSETSNADLTNNKSPTQLNFPKSDSSESKEPIENLNIPPVERLLPIGPKPSTDLVKTKDSLNLLQEDVTDSSKFEPDASKINTAKSPEPARTRIISPRKLARQPALSSPGDDLTDVQTRKGVHSSLWWNQDSAEARAASHADPCAKTANAIGYRCAECGQELSMCTDEEAGACGVLLTLFAQTQPQLAAHTLPHALELLAHLTTHTSRSSEVSSAASRQLLRCALHRLAPHDAFLRIFSSKQSRAFLKSMAQSLLEFGEMSPCAPMQLLCEHLSNRKAVPVDSGLLTINIQAYLSSCSVCEYQCVGACSPDALLRALHCAHPPQLIAAAISLFRVHAQHPHHCKNILEPISKVVSYYVQNFVIKLSLITELCAVCMKVFGRDRDRFYICRVLVYELMQALKTKTTIPDENFFILLHFVLQGHGCSLVLPPQVQPPDLLDYGNDLDVDARKMLGAAVVDCMRPHLPDLIDLLQDPNLLNKIKGSVSKSLVNRNLISLNEDSVGGMVKAGLGQYVVMEMSSEHTHKQPHQHIWMPITPGREPVEALPRMRVLCWCIGGALCVNHKIRPTLPAHAACLLGELVQYILSSISAGNNPSLIPIPSMLWALTLGAVYTLWSATPTPQLANHQPLADWWARLMPALAELANHNRMMAETINLHFLNLIESLRESNPTVLNKMLPLWTPLLNSTHNNMARHVRERIVSASDFRCSLDRDSNDTKLLVRFFTRMAQLELHPHNFYVI